jgi:osmoprotectant transport system ATP-binding protein
MTDSHSNQAVIAFERVWFRMDGRDLLADFSLAVNRGETVVLLGRSGSGKTTVLRLINGLICPSGGAVRVEGRPTDGWDPVRLRRRIGYVIQEGGLFPHFTVEANIALIPKLEGWPPERIHPRVQEMLSLVGLNPEEFRSRYPHQLSGGQRQRVGVARALAADPPILLLDEPFGALDPLTRSETQREFLALKQRVSKTIVFVTHDVTEALLLASRIALIEAGRLAGIYSPEEFLQSTEGFAMQYVNVYRAGADLLRGPGRSS